MTTQNNKLKEELNPQSQDKRALWFGGLIVFLIALSPFIFYTYKSFPEGDLWKTYFFEWKTAYGSWFNAAWYLTSKIVPLYLFLIWFFTCKHWWHWIILVPVSMYSFQLLSIINESNGIDEVELLYMIPILLFLVPIVYLIRAKLFNKIRGNNLA
ncbi:MAG: hypothetical protein R3359_11345, partial [Marinirhabdus sp.]|nr:hypothetical protein [Marinirhabdus sp.]